QTAAPVSAASKPLTRPATGQAARAQPTALLAKPGTTTRAGLPVIGSGYRPPPLGPNVDPSSPAVLRAFASRASSFRHSYAFSPDGKLLALTGGGSISGLHAVHLKLWDVGTKQVARTLVESGGPMRPIFSPDGKSVVSWVFPDEIDVWNVATGAVRTIKAPS